MSDGPVMGSDGAGRAGAPGRAVPASGVSRVRVRYVECDPMGVAHHSSYVAWLEMARTELLRDCGVTYAQLEREGVFLVITRLDLRYRRPIRYDDLVDVRVRVVGGGRVKIRHEYELVLVERLNAAPDASDPAVPADGVCSIGSTELACVGADGRVRELPGWLMARDGD